MRKLAIVVGCTNRKCSPVPADLAVRSLDPGSIGRRADQWIERIGDARGSTHLLDLYMGEAWQQAKELLTTAQENGYDADLFVVSAGLGIRHATSLGPVYGATFARGNEDSVAADGANTVQWWQRIKQQPGSLPTDEALRDHMLIVASDSYGQVIADDIDRWHARCDDLLLVGGTSGQNPKVRRLPADRSLRRELGGTASSLTLRMARQWLGLVESRLLTDDDVRSAWQKWSQTSRHVEVYDRIPMSDDEVRAFLEEILAEQPETSATRALRQLRDSGRACEQRRFHRLHSEMAG